MAATKPKKKKERALDLRRLLNAVSYKNYNFYDSLSEAELKEFSPYVLMRFTSNVKGDQDIQEWFLEMTNEMVNKNHWDLSKNHESLLWKLYASIGVGESCNYEYLPAPKNEFDKFEKLIAELNPTMKIGEVKILAKMMDKTDRQELFEKMGFDKKQRKEYD